MIYLKGEPCAAVSPRTNKDMKKYNLITPEGTCDLLYEDCFAGKETGTKIHKIFKSRGYRKIITPGLEFYDVFNSGAGFFPQEILYKLTDSKGRLLVVRPDSTIPIARVAATRLRDSALPMRLYYSQKVYRSKPALKGRSDEFLQTGVELIGSASAKADLEVLTMAVDVLREFQEDGFRLEIGDAGLFKELVSRLNASDDEREEIRLLIETKNYPALNDVLDGFGKNEITDAIRLLPGLFGGADVIAKARTLVKDDKIFSVLDRLEYLYTTLEKLGFGDKVIIDLGIVNKLDYYTGVIMNGYLEGCGGVVLSGGRYDKLLETFGMDAPATGFAVNVDAVSRLMKKKNGAAQIPVAEVLVFGMEGYEAEAISYASKLRDNGTAVEHSVEESLDKAREYAIKMHIPHIAVVSNHTELEDVK